MSNEDSLKLGKFLEDNNLHKKDLADMLGVTLSYIYNLVDPDIYFSSRKVTLERLATIMGIEPSEFSTYVADDFKAVSEPAEYIKDTIKENNLTVVQFLKKFPPNRRLDLVDILRGAKPVPLSLLELLEIANILNWNKAQLCSIWEPRFKQVLELNGFDTVRNSSLYFEMVKEFNHFIKETK